jgi:hypothetical protein
MENIVIGFGITVCIIGIAMLIAIPFIIKPGETPSIRNYLI